MYGALKLFGGDWIVGRRRRLFANPTLAPVAANSYGELATALTLLDTPLGANQALLIEQIGVLAFKSGGTSTQTHFRLVDNYCAIRTAAGDDLVPIGGLYLPSTNDVVALTMSREAPLVLSMIDLQDLYNQYNGAPAPIPQPLSLAFILDIFNTDGAGTFGVQFRLEAIYRILTGIAGEATG